MISNYDLSGVLKNTFAWVWKALAKDASRPVLQHMDVQKSHIKAANGWVLHAAKVENATNDPGLYRPEKDEDKILDLVPLDDDRVFPDIDIILPTRKPLAVICLDTKILKNAVSGFSDFCILAIYEASPDPFGHESPKYQGKNLASSPMEILGHTEDGISAYALLMPAFLKEEDVPTWKPKKEKANGTSLRLGRV